MNDAFEPPVEAPTGDLLVRRHVPSDRQALKQLLEIAILETYPDLQQLSPARLKDRVEGEFAHYYAIRDKDVWVGEVDGKVAGCLWCMESFHPVTGMPDLFVINVAVFPEFQGRGLARKLFAEATEHARQRGLPFLRLFVNPANRAAYQLYERLGFVAQTHEMRLEVAP